MKKPRENLKADIEGIEAIIRRRGAVVGHDPATAGWIRYMFLKQVIDCPRCAKLDPREH